MCLPRRYWGCLEAGRAATPDILPRVSAITGRTADDRALAALLGESPVRCESTRWGFDATTRLVTMASGRQVVMQARAADLGAGHALAIRTASGALQTAGLKVPRLIGVTVSAGRELLVFELVPGRPGPELLADPVRGPALARSMGGLARSLAAIVTTAIPGDPAWTAPDMLRRASQAWLDRLGREAQMVAADGAVTDVVTGALAEVGRVPWTAVVTHGDYVPANVLVADGGALTLLDLGSVAGRHPALDAAWWALIVRHHHPDLAPALSQAFRTEAWERDVAPEDRLLASLALVRALHLAAEREPGDHRRHLLGLAASAVTWTGSVART